MSCEAELHRVRRKIPTSFSAVLIAIMFIFRKIAYFTQCNQESK
jgi:hypothetical protein